MINGVGINLEEWKVKKSFKNEISFIYIGRLLIEKGITEFIISSKKIKTLFPKVKFYILGDYDESKGSRLFRKKLNTLSNPDHINFIVNGDVKQWLTQSSVFVLPSYREGMPRSSMEALAMGLPIITTDVPGCKDTVIDSWNGFLIKPRDVFSLEVAMKKFIKEPYLIYDMSKKVVNLLKNILMYLKLMIYY